MLYTIKQILFHFLEESEKPLVYFHRFLSLSIDLYISRGVGMRSRVEWKRVVIIRTQEKCSLLSSFPGVVYSCMRCEMREVSPHCSFL